MLKVPSDISKIGSYFTILTLKAVVGIIYHDLIDYAKSTFGFRLFIENR